MFYLTKHSTRFIYVYMASELHELFFYLTTHSTRFIYAYMASELHEIFFYLTTHSTHFIYGYKPMALDIHEENVLFNEELNTFYLRLYSVGYSRRKCFI